MKIETVSHPAMVEEHEAWRKMFNQIRDTFGLTDDELNKPKYRKIFEMIERWAYYDKKRREVIIEFEGEEYPYGCFWKGDEKWKE